MISQVDEIKDRLDVREVIQSYVKLQKAGASWKGLCPFHNEKTPSFTVSPEKQMWYCFGCSEGGDIFSFIEKIEGVEFSDALRTLAEKAGVKLKKEDPKITSRRKKLYEISSLAAKFFSRQLESKKGKMVLDYLKGRGLEDATISDWQLGYAPDNWQSLGAFLKERGYGERDVEAAGLIVKSDNTKHPYHDRFRNRIIFPIFDIQDQVIGFAGRIFEEVSSKTLTKDAGKYINTPNTDLYDKSRVLYGLHNAKSAVKDKDNCMLVEGNIDVIMAHQAGNKNTVAVSGTALGESHLAIIKRYTNNLSICFDSDDAGFNATKKGALLAISKGFDASVVKLPAGKDAADIIIEDISLWQKKTEETIPFVEFVLGKILESYSPKTLEGKKEISKNILPIIKIIPSPVERDHWVGELSVATGINESILAEELKRVKVETQYSEPENIPKGSVLERKVDNLEEHLLALLLVWPEGKKLIKESLSLVSSPSVKEALDRILEAKKGAVEIAKEPKFASIVVRSVLLGEIIEDKEGEFLKTIDKLKKKRVKEKLVSIEANLKKAESENNLSKIKELLGEFNSLSQELTESENEKVKKI